MSRYAKLELEDSQGAASTTTSVFGTAFYLPATEVAFNPKPKPLDRSDEIRGIDGQLTQAQNEYEPDGSIEIRGYANYLGALLMLLFGDVTTTAGNGSITDPSGTTIPVGAYRHEFVKLSGSTPKSARVTQAYGEQFVQGRGVTLKNMAFNIEEDGVKAKCDAMANYLSRLTSDPSFTPSYDAFSILPFRRRNVALTLPIGTKLIEAIEFTFEQELEYVRDMGDSASSGFPTRTERANSVDGFLKLGGKVTRRDLDSEDWEALIACTEFDLLVKMASEQNIGATSYPYSLFVQAGSAQFVDGDLEGQKNQPRHQQELTWQAGYNESDGYDMKVTLVDSVAAYK